MKLILWRNDNQPSMLKMKQLLIEAGIAASKAEESAWSLINGQNVHLDVDSWKDGMHQCFGWRVEKDA